METKKDIVVKTLAPLAHARAFRFLLPTNCLTKVPGFSITVIDESKNILYNPYTIIGKNLKKIRQEKGISQDRLSKLADLSLNTVVTVESGANPNPTIETLKKIAEALGISVNKLI